MKNNRLINYLLNIPPAMALGWFFANVWFSGIDRAIFISHKQQLKLFLIMCLFYLVIICLRRICLGIANHFKLRRYWIDEFSLAVNAVLALLSLFYLVYLTHIQIVEALIIFLIVFGSYFILRSSFKKHPVSARDLVAFSDAIFLIFSYILLAAIIFQGFALRQFYTIDSVTSIDNMIPYRSLAVTSFWLISLSLIFLIFKRDSKNRRRIAIAWLLAYLAVFILEIINAGVIYYSGLYINPVILEHLAGGGAVVASSINFPIIVLILIVPSVILIFLFLILYKRLTFLEDKHRKAFSYSLFAIGLVSFTVFLPPSGNLPEKTIIASFLNYYFAPRQEIVLNDVALKKLERFGLFYDQNSFIVSRKERIATSSQDLLPKEFSIDKPNIIFISLESFSSRLVSYLGGSVEGLTPNIDVFAIDKNTTVFHNFYNASTPTITGLIAQMCSFLPPTGHGEIVKQDNFSNYLICLPSVLKDNGYGNVSYLTAVNRNFASKNTIFRSMGFDNIYGAEEIIAGTGESGKSVWGVTDHQQFPYLFELIKKQGDEPFFFMIWTIDGHTPFNMSKDVTKYREGDNDVLNSIHSTDDAIGRFLEEFRLSKFASNTIIILAADHAFFPNYFPEKYFPRDESGGSGFYDETVLMINIPDNILPRNISTYSSSIDIAPTIMDLLGINGINYFDGHSIFSSRVKYPNLLGMHEFGLYINQENSGSRLETQASPQELDCSGKDIFVDASEPFSICEALEFYKWKRKMMNDGRLWIRN